MNRLLFIFQSPICYRKEYEKNPLLDSPMHHQINHNDDNNIFYQFRNTKHKKTRLYLTIKYKQKKTTIY